ncbi:MAG: capsular polysaccharide transport system permease protein [Acetobacteraceae bacterium]|nr:capsular polysaccharide transport system permease protein [Acetobacteraceae bacterium]
MPPEAPDAWADIIQPEALSRLEPLYTPPRGPTRLEAKPRTLLRVILLILLPTLLTGLYFGLIASDRYVSEARFVVRKPNSPNRGPAQSLSIEEGPKGLGGDDSYVVRDFLESRDALALVVDKANFRASLADAGSDWLWKFPGPLTGHSNEDLYQLYQSLVTVDYDSATGLTVLHIEAFDPEEAQRIAVVLMDGGEALLNRMNERARADAMHVAETEVARSKQLALAAQERVTAFRDRESIIDPTQISKTVLNTMAVLSLQLVETRAQLDVTLKESPNSPQIVLLRSRVAALQQQIDHERGTLAGDNGSLAPRIAEYERLTLQRSFAEKSFVSALNQLEAARLDAERQQDYLESVVRPRIADEARYPMRLRWIAGTFLAGCAVFWMFRPRASAKT